MKRFGGIVSLLLITAAFSFAQRTDLSGLKFCIDPGHGGFNSNDRHLVPDPGVDFWESESNFQKALLLKSLLEAKGATVLLTRTSNSGVVYPNPDDSDEPSLSARYELANANNVDWFHSIHSNAFNGATNYTLVLLKEDIATRQPAFPEALAMSNLIAPSIRQHLRTSANYVYLDYTFYGGPNGGFNLGVLRGLIMPGELSEGSFHDVFPETRRLMNNSYRKMEAYALRDAFMEYFGVPADPLSTIAGIQKDVATSAPLNFTQVRLLPENRVYVGDGYNNGFYLFDSLSAGPHVIRFVTPGRFPDSLQAIITAGSMNFIDRMLESTAFPAVMSSVPVNGDTAYAPNGTISIQFSKPMDTASVRRAFSIAPTVAGKLAWGGNLTQLVFTADTTLPFHVAFTVSIDTSARSLSGQPIDGNGDGLSGDPYVLIFRTKYADVVPPRLAVRYPVAGALQASADGVVTMTFDEPLNPSTVTTGNFAIQQIGGSLQARSVEYSESAGKGGVTMYVTQGFQPGLSYRVRVGSVGDLAGNVIPTSSWIIWDFTVSAASYQTAVLDAFDSAPDSWLPPGGSGSTVGIDSASFAFSAAKKVQNIATNIGSGELRYLWKTGASDFLIREYLSGGAARNVLFRKDRTVLQVYLHGDGSGTQFRFAVDDSVDGFPGGAADHHEVGPWTTVDWVGWRRVEWDLEKDSVGSWLGNGVLEGQLRFDSFQLRKTPTSSPGGQISFDQLQLAQRIVTDVAEGEESLPSEFSLGQNYPNPFNPSTVIRYSVGQPGQVTITVYDLLGREVGILLDQRMDPGRYQLRFEGRGLSSGMYVYRMTAGGHTFVRKMLLTK